MQCCLESSTRSCYRHLRSHKRYQNTESDETGNAGVIAARGIQYSNMADEIRWDEPPHKGYGCRPQEVQFSNIAIGKALSIVEFFFVLRRAYRTKPEEG